MEKKAVTWNYPIGAELKVVGQINVGKVTHPASSHESLQHSGQLIIQGTNWSYER